MTRRSLVIALGIALLACCVTQAEAQRWKYPPGPPYRTCPDTLTIFQVQNPDTLAVPCHPATLDTVWGVKGIVIGFDARPSAYATYIQTAGGGPYTGVNVFTGATNYNGPVAGSPSGGNLALGDLIAVYGTTQEFPASNGETEIEGPDAIQGTDDIVIRRLSSANPLPPFQVGTTHDFNWVPGSPGNLGEQYEGALVKVRGPLRVARTSGLGLLGNNWLMVSVASPSPDSIMIDGFTLASVAVTTPAVGTVVDSVQGILNQRTSGAPSANSYRIQLRNGNDMFLAVPPGLAEAYPLEDNQLRLLFDRNVDVATAEVEANYSLGSGIDGSTVDLATVVAPNVVVLNITSVLVDGDAETITSSGIGSSTCPGCLSPSQTVDFINGVLGISMLQGADPDSLGGSPCNDRSRFAGGGTAFGPRLTTRGVAVQSYGSLYYIQTPGGGARTGVSIFGPLIPLVTGRQYRIAGRIQEFAGETEIVNTVDILDEGVAAVPAASLQTVNDLADITCDVPGTLNTGEDWEGVLVRVEQVMVVNFNTAPQDPSPGGSFRVVQPAGLGAPDTILVSALGGHYTYDPTAGDVLNVTGVLHFDNTNFRILPRGDSDIEFEGSPSTTALAANPAKATQGEKVTLTATVTPYGVTGTVEFYDGTTLLGSTVLDGQGRAVLSTTALAIGTHVIKAVYPGDAAHTGSQSTPVNVEVNPPSEISYKDATSPNGIPDFKQTKANCWSVAVANCLWYWDHHGFGGLVPHSNGDPGNWKEDGQALIDNLDDRLAKLKTDWQKALPDYIKSRGKNWVPGRAGLVVKEYSGKDATYALFKGEISRCQDVIPFFKAHKQGGAEGEWVQVGPEGQKRDWYHAQTAAGWDTSDPPSKIVFTNGWHTDNAEVVAASNYDMGTIAKPGTVGGKLRMTSTAIPGKPPTGADYLEMTSLLTVCPLDEAGRARSIVGSTHSLPGEPPRAEYDYRIENPTAESGVNEPVWAVGVAIDVPFTLSNMNVHSPPGWTVQEWVPSATPGLVPMFPYVDPDDDLTPNPPAASWRGLLWTTNVSPVLPDSGLSGFSFELPDLWEISPDAAYVAIGSAVEDSARIVVHGFAPGPVNPLSDVRGGSERSGTNEISTFPNPANPDMTIQLKLTAPAFVRVRVYDVAGRLVTRLVATRLGSGVHHVAWSGKDARGHRVDPGTYVVLAEFGGEVHSRKLVIVR